MSSGGSNSIRPLPRKTISAVLPPTAEEGISTPSSRRSVAKPAASFTFFNETAREGSRRKLEIWANSEAGSGLTARAAGAPKTSVRQERTRAQRRLPMDNSLQHLTWKCCSPPFYFQEMKGLQFLITPGWI